MWQWAVGAGLLMSKKDRRNEEVPVDEDRRASGRDRRRFERVLVDVEVDYGHDDTFLFAYITDISAMGIFIRTNNPEPAGTRMNLRFTPPGLDEPLELEGLVIWVNPYRPGDRDNLNPGMGVQFVDLEDWQLARLTDFVKTFAYLSSPDDDDDDDGAPPAAGAN